MLSTLKIALRNPQVIAAAASSTGAVMEFLPVVMLAKRPMSIPPAWIALAVLFDASSLRPIEALRFE